MPADPTPDQRTLWVVVPVARELLPALIEGVPASSVRLQRLDTSPRAYDLVVTNAPGSGYEEPDPLDDLTALLDEYERTTDATG